MKNQCDGCRRGNVPVEGMHYWGPWNGQSCVAADYAEPKDQDQKLTGERESAVCTEGG